MPVYQLPYTEIWVPPSAAFPVGRAALRPILRLTLTNGPHRLSCYGIVDSGADHCVFPRSFMQPLGLDPLIAPIELSTGVGSSNVPTHFCNVRIDLQGAVQFLVYAGFTSGLDAVGFGLLGQAGFFERFRITFDLPQKTYAVEVP